MKTLSEKKMAELARHLERREKKEKTSISLSGELVAAVDMLAGKAGRSAFIERALRRYLESKARRWRNAKDLEIINANAEGINRESDWILEVQAWPD